MLLLPSHKQIAEFRKLQPLRFYVLALVMVIICATSCLVVIGVEHQKKPYSVVPSQPTSVTQQEEDANVSFK